MEESQRPDQASDRSSVGASILESEISDLESNGTHGHSTGEDQESQGDEALQEMRRREQISRLMVLEPARRKTLVLTFRNLVHWCQETFPGATTSVAHLPFSLVPLTFCMFILVQALVSRGWIAVFAHGWDHWVDKTGTVGAVGGMGFLAVILCNIGGTDIGATILLSRVIQTWQIIHQQNGTPLSNRTFWATVYSMAMGVNYGAFGISYHASMSGRLWRDILDHRDVRVRSIEFFRVNLPIIACAMMVGCTVLLGEVYIVRNNNPYILS